MANINRYKYGDADPRVARANVGTTIEIGDLVMLEGAEGGLKNLQPASMVPNDIPTTMQSYCACRFLGHASQQHRPSHDPLDDPDIRVNSGGVHEYSCASRTWEVGDLVAAAVNAAGTALLNQTVSYVPKDAGGLIRAIGVVAQREPVANTRVYVELMPRAAAEGISDETCSGSSSSGE
jgi:hypothetical protein